MENNFFDTDYFELLLVLGSLQNSDYQSQFSMFRINRIFIDFFIIQAYDFRCTFFIIDIFWKLQFLKHFITKNEPNFCQLRSSLYQKKLVLNLLIYKYLHCVRSLSWSAIIMDTLSVKSAPEKLHTTMSVSI